MDEIIKYISNNSILVVPNNIKEKVLNLVSNSNYINIKIMSLNDLINKLTFIYDEETINFVMNKYNLPYVVSKNYLDLIKYVNVSDSDNKKIKYLIDIKNNVDNMLIRDKLFLNFISDKKVIIYGYDYINKYEKSIISKLNNVEIIEKNYKDYNHDVYNFKTLEEEVVFVAEKISGLIKSGIDINNIYLSNIDSNYYSTINRIFNMYNIPCNINNKVSIYETIIGKYFIDNILCDINETLDIIKNIFDFENNYNNLIFKEIIKIINNFYFVSDYRKVKENIIEIFKNTYINKNLFKNAINNIDIIDNEILDNEYVFLLGFNLNSIPRTVKDEDYINDGIKPDILETSHDINIINKEIWKKVIKNIKNLYISYKEKYINDEYYPSLIIDELNLKIIKENVQYSHYSNKLNVYYLANSIDNLIKFNEKNDNIKILYSNYKIPYKSYKNTYSGINKDKLRNYLNNKLTLSYSSMNNYYNCSFRYYLSNILKLDKFEDRLNTYIGNLFHYILSKCFQDNFDFNKEVQYFLNNNEYEKSNKNKYFINKVLNDLEFVINTIKYQNELGNMDHAYYEKEVIINKDGLLNTVFKGYIDKLLIKDNYCVIIDYKTYDVDISLDYLPFGLSMQLPVYLYLTKNINKDYKIIGFYLQKVLPNIINKDYKKNMFITKKDELKLRGYTSSDINRISIFDKTYENSELIKSLKMSSKGFYQYSKIISDEEIDKIIKETDNNINNCIESIANAKFDINPKSINKNIVGCDFCKFKDICYMTNNDIVYLDK